MRSGNEKSAGNTLCIANGFEAAWAYFCPSCGSIDQMVAADSALPVSDSELVVCAHCGAQIKAQAKFCPYCGSGTGK